MSFRVLGDSNVKRFFTLVNRRACPDLDQAEIIVCGKLPLFRQAAVEMPEGGKVIVACITNYLASSSGVGETASLRVEPILLDVRQVLLDLCSRSDFVLLCPPMYRGSPLWYRDGLADILGKFSQIMSQDRPSNLLLMPSFSSPVFDQDGIHLSPTSGLEYLFHLFDSARDVIHRSTLEVPALVDSGSEATRVLQDRVMALEQDHRRLNKSYEMSQAISSEREDFQENVRNESSFMVSGLPRITNLRGREWMARAISDVQNMIKTLLGKELKIQVVHNATGRATDAEVRYSVKMESAADSQEVRAKFGSYFAGGQDRRPDGLRSVSVSNKITPGTQVRLMILKLMARRYSTANPDAKVRVVGYEPRPIIKITPPESSSDRRVKVFTYIEAISKLPTCFTSAELRPIVAKARVHFKGSLRSTFVVLSDDAPQGTARAAAPGQPADQAADQPTEPSDADTAEENDDEPESINSSSIRASNSRKRTSATVLGPESQRARR